MDRLRILVIVMLVLLLASLGLALATRARLSKGDGSHGEQSSLIDAVPRGRWVVIGAGVAAAASVLYTPPPIRAAMSLREASQRFGGRLLSVPQPVNPVSTAVPMFELGAWAAVLAG